MTDSLFSFPNPVNEVSARLVAGGVVLIALAAIIFAQPWIFGLLAFGFVARVLTGPTLSPLGQFVTRVLTPALPFEEKLVAGPPKRFAQAIGAAFSLTAAVLAIGFDQIAAASVVVAVLAAFAILESVFGICVGCKVFALMMRAGLVPAEVCESCNKITLGEPTAAAGSR